jgi:hypothetical protein
MKHLLFIPIIAISLINAYSLSYNTTVEPLDTLCNNIDNAGICGELIEKHQLKYFGNIVKRLNKDSIEISLVNKMKIILFNGSDPGKDNFYTFRDFLKPIGYLLFRVQRIEGNYYLLVNINNGNKYPINDLPIISPDNKLFITCSLDMEANYNPNELELYKITSDSLVKIDSYNYPASDGVWLGPETFTFNVNSYDTITPMKYIKTKYKVFYYKNKWQFLKQE